MSPKSEELLKALLHEETAMTMRLDMKRFWAALKPVEQAEFFEILKKHRDLYYGEIIASCVEGTDRHKLFSNSMKEVIDLKDSFQAHYTSFILPALAQFCNWPKL